MQYYELKLPDIGEGTAEGEIIKWLVSEGDAVKEDQPVVEVVTEKVNVEIPSPKSGKISKILAKEGDVVKVGQGLVLLEVYSDNIAQDSLQAQTPSAPNQIHEATPMPSIEGDATDDSVIATPATRKYAKDLGVNIKNVVGSGPRGRVTVDDVKNVAEKQFAANITMAARTETATTNEERVPLRGIRKTIAERMIRSAHNAAHVTHVDEAEVTELIQLRNRLKIAAESKSIKLTFLPLLIKAVIPALKEFPYMNASIDDEKSEIVLKKYYNIGIATDTDQGLIVPVIVNADKKNIFELATEVEYLSTKARAGSLNLDEVRGSTFTISNVGSIGGLFTTPIINLPEVAILGIQRIVKRPVVRNDGIAMRDLMNLSLSFDHRAVDGAYVARFMNRVIEIIQDPKDLAT